MLSGSTDRQLNWTVERILEQQQFINRWLEEKRTSRAVSQVLSHGSATLCVVCVCISKV